MLIFKILITYLTLVEYLYYLLIHKSFFCISINSSNIYRNNIFKISKFSRNQNLSFVNSTFIPRKFEKNLNQSSEYVTTVEVDNMSHDLDDIVQDSTNVTTQIPKTNLVLTVSYDGSNYFGMVGPFIFLNEYGIPIKSKNTNTDSIVNQLMKTITLIHGYFGKKRRLKLKNLELSKKLKPEINGTNGVNGIHKDDENELFDFYEDFTNKFCMITSSRTDRGVHSMGTACQYHSYDKKLNFKSLEEFQDSLNKRLPDDIRVTSVIYAPSDKFNVRHHNIGKCYLYKVDLSSKPPLYERNYYWQIMSDTHFINTLLRKYKDIRSSFSIEKVKEAGKVFHGTHNFEGFRKTSRGNERANVVDPICTIENIEFINHPDEKLYILVKGNRFLYKMVRTIVGHLILKILQAGFNAIKPEQIKDALDNGTEIPNIPYAPAHGLYLKEVYFEKEVQDKINESRNKYYERRDNLLK